MKVITIVGARPQFIKLSPLSKQISALLNEIIIHTGQHFDKEMSNQFFKDLDIPEPDYNLGIHGGCHGEQTGRMLIALEEIIKKENPSLIIIFGDTNSTLAGSLVASKLNINSIHIEAGLRSFNKSMPEEINRIVSDHISDYLFAPTLTAVNNLKNEGVIKKTYLTGDIMVDSLKNNIERANHLSKIGQKLNIRKNKYFLLTLHRPYTVDDPINLNLILSRISDLDIDVIFPIHPRTQKIIIDNKMKVSDKIKIIKPVGYLDFIFLEQNADKIITDSGGVQKEAYILMRPCITIRPETEWIETVEDGWNLLMMPNNENFCQEILGFNPSNKQRNIFGNNVTEKMINKIKEIAFN